MYEDSITTNFYNEKGSKKTPENIMQMFNINNKNDNNNNKNNNKRTILMRD